LSGGSGNSGIVSQLQQVVQIIDTESDVVRREQQIRKLDGGRTYQYIKEHHLDGQRNAGYLRIYFDYK
jgi:hypothetical protein